MLTSTRRLTSSAAIVAILGIAIFGAQLSANPALVSKFGMRADLAESIARAVNTLGHVPWWALVIIGGGVAGVLVRIVLRYGIRYAVSW